MTQEPDANDVAPPGIDPAIAAAIDAVHAAQDIINKLEARERELTEKLFDSIAERDMLAFQAETDGTKQRPYFTACKEADLVRSDLDRCAGALRQARKNHAAALIEVDRRGKAELVKTFARHTIARAKIAAELTATLDSFRRQWLKLVRVNEQIATSWPGYYAQPGSGAALGQKQNAGMIAAELHRLHPVGPLDRGSPLPFAIQPLGVDPRDIPPFAKSIEDANSWVMKIIEGPANIARPE